MWRRILGRRRYEEELHEEFQAHLEIEIGLLMEGGLTREQAEREARRRFGSDALVREVTRGTGPFRRAERVWQDVRYAARILRHSPGFTAATVLSLALGIGVSTAVFSIADTVYLRPLPYAHAERLAWVAIHFPYMTLDMVPSPDYVAWRRDNRAFAQLAATQLNGGTVMLQGGADPMEVHVARVSYNFLSTFGLAPALGRDFLPQEELPDGPKTVLVTDRFWRAQYRGRRDAIGQPLILDGQAYSIAGVLPAGFVFPMDVKVDVLTNFRVSPSASHRDRNMGAFAVFGRLKPGVTMAAARADAATLLAASTADFPAMFRAGTKPVVQSLQQHRVGDPALLVRILVGAVGCLLLIACANVANLLLARWSARSRELAVRAAIGATRGRLVQQLFTETALLTAMGCLLGMALVAAALRGFVHFAAGELPRLSEVAVDGRVLGIALAVSVATALLFSGLPVLRAGRMDIQTVLQQAGRRGVAGGHGLLRRGLVAAEVATSIVLLSGAALLLQTLWHLQRDRLGFRPEHAVSITIPMGGAKRDAGQRAALADGMLAFLQRLPGTEAAAETQCTPMTFGQGTRVFSRSDRPTETFRGYDIAICGVGPDYFRAAATRLVDGRVLTADDFRHPATVALLNETAARTYFPGENPLGRRIGGGPQSGWKTVIGVVADTRNRGLGEAAFPQMFVNDTASPDYPLDPMFLLRTLADERAVADAVRGELRARHAGLFAKIQTLDEAIGESTASQRFNSALLSSFATVAFLMAVVGVYGVLAFSVAERTQEIGIRMALGAEPRTVLASVLREGALLAGVGSAAGVCGALVLTQYLKVLLYGIQPTDAATYAVVVIGLGLAASIASYLPARRAAAVDPMVALRMEG